MSLIIEDGSIVEDANSFVSIDDYISYAAIYGIEITEEDAEIQLIKSVNYININENKLNGYRVSRDQSLSYPRRNLKINSFWWDTDEIPDIVIKCQMELALDIKNNKDLYNIEYKKGPVIGRKIDGAIDIKYAAAPVITSRTKTMGLMLLDQLMNIKSGFQSINLVRG